jgi:predicted ATP-dependent protease
VIVPYANRVNLMLREDVVAACGRGKFHIFPVGHIDDGLEILSGLPAGKRGRSGAFSRGSFNRAVEDRLTDMAALRRKFNDLSG